MRIEVDGQAFEVPDDASLDEIDAITKPMSPGTAMERGIESGIPFAGDLRANVMARLSSTSPAEMQKRAELGPLGIDREELLAKAGLPANPAPGTYRIPASVAQGEPQRPPVTGPITPPAENLAQAHSAVDIERQRAWDEHPWWYAPGKVMGWALTDKGLGAAVPWAGSASIPQGRFAAKLLPAARVGAAQGAVYGADRAPTVGAIPGTMAQDAAFGAVAGPTFEVARAGAGALGTALVNKLGRSAEQNAIRALESPSGVGKMVTRYGAESVPAAGRTALDQGIPLRTPHAALAGATERMNEVGPAISALTQAADQRGATVDMTKVFSRLQNDVFPEMMKDPQQQPIVAAIKDYLSKAIQARGNWPGPNGQRQLMSMAPSEAHALRQNLDLFLYGVQKNLDPSGTLTRASFRNVRRALSDELGQTMSSAGLGPQWAAANPLYEQLTRVQGLARGGVRNAEVAAAGTQGDTLLKLKDLKLPGPKPATKAAVQNTLYRLLGPAKAPEPNLLPGAAAAGPAAPMPPPSAAPRGPAPAAPPAAGPAAGGWTPHIPALRGLGLGPENFPAWRPPGPEPVVPPLRPTGHVADPAISAQPPIEPDLSALTVRGPKPQVVPPMEPTEAELAQARAEVLAGKKAARKYTRRKLRMSPPEEE